MPTPHALSFLLILLSFFIPFASGQEFASKADSITIGELRDHVFFLASDALGGRVIESAGYEIAAQYAASQFRNAGLRPMFKDAKGLDTFFQEVPIVKIEAQRHSNVVIKLKENSINLDYAKNILWRRYNSFQVFTVPRPVVFVGYGIEEPGYGWNDFQNVDLAGKIAVMMVGTPMDGDRSVLPAEVQKKYAGLSGASRKIDHLVQKASRPAAILVMGGQELLDAWDGIGDILSQSGYVLKRNGESALETQRIDVLLVKPEIGAALLRNQIYNPFSVKDDGEKTYKIFELQNVEFKIDITEVRKEIVTWNVVGLIPGTDPALRDQYVTVGAHLDHIPMQNGQVCNGADDNASGCAGVMEIAEAIAANPLKRPVIAALWAAEEAGSHLMGSKYFLRHPPVEMGKIKVNVTLDMIGLTTESEVKSRAHLVFGYANTLDEFRTIIDRVNGRTVRWPLDYGEDSSSDHASFHEKGIPAFFFCSGTSAVTHTPGDDPEIMDYEKMVSIARLAYEVVCELGNSKEIPVKIR